MNATARETRRNNARKGAGRRTGILAHKVSTCDATDLPRYRDRHQARQAAQARAAGERDFKVSTFACPDCHGFHHETMPAITPIVAQAVEPVAEVGASEPARKRRFFLVDIENLTHGAQASPAEVAALWNVLTQQAPGVTARDHVVIGAARKVVRKYRAAVRGANVKWVVGADVPDGADHALLAAINLHHVARDFDELVIASGDHAFADVARRARARGLNVQVLSTEHPDGRTMLAQELAEAATTRTRIRLSSRRQHLANIAAFHAVAQAAVGGRDIYAKAA